MKLTAPILRTSTVLAFAAILVLFACTPLPAPGTPQITVASASFHGSTSTRIFADGTLIAITANPGKPPVQTVQTSTPDAYARAAAVIAAEGAATKLALKRQTDQCLDYGTDQVTASRPIAGFDQVSTACPDPAMTALMDHVLAALAAK